MLSIKAERHITANICGRQTHIHFLGIVFGGFLMALETALDQGLSSSAVGRFARELTTQHWWWELWIDSGSEWNLCVYVRTSWNGLESLVWSQHLLPSCRTKNSTISDRTQEAEMYVKGANGNYVRKSNCNYLMREAMKGLDTIWA